MGFNVRPEGILPTERKVSEISDFPTPSDSKSLRRFLGMVGFYRNLIPKFADAVLPLTELIKLNQNAKHLDFSEAEKEAFSNIKQTLAELTALPHPVSSVTHFHLVTDSSSYAVGAALHQIVNDQPVPIGFFSKKLSEAQRKQSTFDRELLAVFLAVLKFRPAIECRHVTVFTDHKPLV